MEEIVSIAVQINGKVRGSIVIAVDDYEKLAVQVVLTHERVASFLSDEGIMENYYVKGKVLNIVTTCV